MNKIIKSIIVVTLAIIMIMPSIVFAKSRNQSFYDIENHWAKEWINNLSSRKTISGYPDGSFGPDNIIKRGEFLKIAMSTVENGKSYSSTSDYHWASGVLDYAYKKNIVTREEIPATFEGLDKAISRFEMAKIAIRLNEYIQKEESVVVNGISSLMPDYSSVPNEYKYFVEQAYAKGLLTGSADGSYLGENTTKRSEACVVIVRMVEKEKRSKIVSDVFEKDIVEKYSKLDNNYYENIIQNMKNFQLLKKWEDNILLISNGDYQFNIDNLDNNSNFGDYFVLEIDSKNNKDLAWCSIYLSESLDFNNYCTFDLTQKIIDSEKILILNKKQFSFIGDAFNWDKINYIKIAFESKKELSFEIHPISFSTYGADAMCTLWLDDGWEDNYSNAFRIANSINSDIDAEVSIISSKIGKENYMNEKQLKEIAEAGWGLSNHTFSHKYLGEIPFEESEKEIKNSIIYIHSIAGKGSLNIVPPYSSVNNKVLNLIKKTGISCRYIPEKFNLIPTNRYKIAYKEVKSTTDFKTVSSWIDEAIDKKYWLVLLFHKVQSPVTDTTVISTEKFQRIVKYLDFKKNEIRTVNTNKALEIMGYK